jgi:hypothetical protein
MTDDNYAEFIESLLNAFGKRHVSATPEDALKLQDKLLHAERDTRVDHAGILYSNIDPLSVAS